MSKQDMLCAFQTVGAMLTKNLKKIERAALAATASLFLAACAIAQPTIVAPLPGSAMPMNANVVLISHTDSQFTPDSHVTANHLTGSVDGMPIDALITHSSVSTALVARNGADMRCDFEIQPNANLIRAELATGLGTQVPNFRDVFRAQVKYSSGGSEVSSRYLKIMHLKAALRGEISPASLGEEEVLCLKTYNAVRDLNNAKVIEQSNAGLSALRFPNADGSNRTIYLQRVTGPATLAYAELPASLYYDFNKKETIVGSGAYHTAGFSQDIFMTKHGALLMQDMVIQGRTIRIEGPISPNASIKDIKQMVMNGLWDNGLSDKDAFAQAWSNTLKGFQEIARAQMETRVTSRTNNPAPLLSEFGLMMGERPMLAPSSSAPRTLGR